MGKHKPRKTKISDACRTVSNSEYLKNRDKNRKGVKKQEDR